MKKKISKYQNFSEPVATAMDSDYNKNIPDLKKTDIDITYKSIQNKPPGPPFPIFLPIFNLTFRRESLIPLRNVEV